MQLENEIKIAFRNTKLYIPLVTARKKQKQISSKPVSTIRFSPEIEELIQAEMKATGMNRTAVITECLLAGMKDRSARALASRLLLASDFIRKLQSEISDDRASDESSNTKS